MGSRLFSFARGTEGLWTVRWQKALRGDAMTTVPNVDVRSHGAARDTDVWSLRGITSNDRYLQRAEKDRLVAAQKASAAPAPTARH